METEFCSCGKRCYTQAEAGNVIRKLKGYRRVSNRKTIPTRSYYCRECGMYHLTHYRKSRSNKGSRERIKKL